MTRVVAALFQLLLVVLLCHETARAQMLMQGAGQVSSSGAARYDIPISVPPGIRDLAPKLSLRYGSQDGNQMAGVGWSLAGLSFITRCPQTRYQDGNITAVDYSNRDRYCLDGRRLVAISGKDGADGSEYRTEVDEISQVKSAGTVGTAPYYGPASFTVKTRDGLVMEFGGTADSRVLAQGLNVVRVWALSKVSDRKGNFMAVSYTADASTGEFQPASIAYTGNASVSPAVAPQSSVVFEYEARPDPIQKYFGGRGVRTVDRLKKIRTTTASVKGDVMSYTLTYDASPSTRRSRLKSVAQCSGSGKCLPPTTITWDATGASANTFVRAGSVSGGSQIAGGCQPYNGYGVVTGDFNGDGLDDVYSLCAGLFFNDGRGGYRYVRPSVTPTFGGRDSLLALFAEDMNGDARKDIVVVWGHSNASDGDGIDYPQDIHIDVLVNVDGNGAFQSQPWVGTGPSLNALPFIRFLPPADIDGDGRPDLVLLNNFFADCDSCSPKSQLVAYVYKNTGTGYSASTQPFPGEIIFSTLQAFLADMDGDGRSDLVVASGSDSYLEGNGGPNQASVTTYLSNGSSFVNPGPGVAVGGFTYNDNIDTFTLGDFNGDGYTDVLRIYRTGPSFAPVANFEFAFNDGRGMTVKRPAITPSVLMSWPVGLKIRDVNDDGKSDIIADLVSGSGGLLVFNSSGDGNLLAEPWISGFQRFFPETWRAAQLDGQSSGGLVQTTYVGPAGTGMSIYNFVPSLITRDLVVDIGTSGLPGTSTRFQYDTLPRVLGTRYFKEAAPAFPRLPIVPAARVAVGMDLPTGQATQRHVSMSYGTMLYEYGGRGNLGLAWMQSKADDTGVATKTALRQDFPYLGLVDRVTQTQSSGALLKSVRNTYACNDFVNGACAVAPGKRYQVWASRVDEQNVDLNGAALPGSRTTVSMNSQGFPLQSTVQTLDGAANATAYQTTTTNVYQDDVASWLLGRVVKTTVTATAPDLPPPPPPMSAALAITGCSSTSATTPAASTMSCTVSNLGRAAVASIGYGPIAGMTVSGPAGACAANSACGTVTVTSGTAVGSYSGTLTATPNSGSAASVAVNLTVKPPPAVLAFGNCSSTAPTTPIAATLTCTLSNTGATAANGISYAALAGMTVSGPTGACAAGSNCGTVTVTTGTAAGTYSGTLTATPDSGNAASTAVSLVVKAPPAALALTGCSSTSPVSPAPATMSCTLGNAGGTAVNSISYGAIPGMTVSGPTGACGAVAWCGIVTVTSGTAMGSYTGTLTAVPDTGYPASVGVSLSVKGSIATLASGNAALSLGSVNVNATPPQGSWTFRNDGTAPMSLNLGALNSPFSVVSNTCANVAPGGSCAITVRMSTASAGSFSQGGIAVGGSTQGARSDLGVNGSVLALLPFAYVSVAPSSDQIVTTATYTFRNGNVSPLAVTGLAASGSAYVGLPITGTCTEVGSLAAGASCTATVVANRPCSDNYPDQNVRVSISSPAGGTDGAYVTVPAKVCF